MGSGGGQSKIGQEADRALAEISMKLYNSTKGLRQETLDQITEGITTGQIGARLPEIQQQLEGSMFEGSTQQQQLTDAAATSGQARTPFAQKQRAAAGVQNAAQTALIPADYIQSIIRTGEGILYGQAPEIAIKGLGQLADIGSAERVAALRNQGNLTSGLIEAGGNLTAGVIGYGANVRAANQATPPPYEGGTGGASLYVPGY